MQKNRSKRCQPSYLLPFKSIIMRQIKVTPQKDKVKLADELFVKLSHLNWKSYSKKEFADWIDTRVCEVYWNKA